MTREAIESEINVLEAERSERETERKRIAHDIQDNLQQRKALEESYDQLIEDGGAEFKRVCEIDKRLFELKRKLREEAAA